MSSSPKIGQIASKTNGLLVQRQGEQLTLRQGDSIYAGDVIQNKDNSPASIDLPAQSINQADSQIILAPDSATAVGLQNANGQTLVEVSPLTGGVELYAVSEGVDGAVLLSDAGGEISGLVGTGLLSAGSFGSIGGLATAIGGGVGVAALATSSGDDINTSGNTFTDVRVDNPDNTGQQPPVTDGTETGMNPGNNPSTDPETPAEEPTDPDTPSDPEQPDPGPTPPDNMDGGTTGTLLDVVLDPLADFLGGTPLAIITEPVFDLLGALPIGSAPNPAQALPLDSISGGLPL